MKLRVVTFIRVSDHTIAMYVGRRLPHLWGLLEAGDGEFYARAGRGSACVAQAAAEATSV
jgi:hypothetical protein